MTKQTDLFSNDFEDRYPALDPATAQYMIVARLLRSGTYIFQVQAMLIRPYQIRTFQLGTAWPGTPAAASPYGALVHAASLAALDDEITSVLG